jgi:hypothetical protein
MHKKAQERHSPESTPGLHHSRFAVYCLTMIRLLFSVIATGYLIIKILTTGLCIVKHFQPGLLRHAVLKELADALNALLS